MDRTPWLDKETGKAQEPGRSKYSSLQVTTGTTSKDVLGGCLIMRRPFLSPAVSKQAGMRTPGQEWPCLTDRQTDWLCCREQQGEQQQLLGWDVWGRERRWCQQILKGGPSQSSSSQPRLLPWESINVAQADEGNAVGVEDKHYSTYRGVSMPALRAYKDEGASRSAESPFV